VSIEFDDGWRNAYELGLPVVESFGFRPTQYVITGMTWSEYMTQAQILDWNARGDIGAHSVTHPNLTQVSASALEYELAESDRALEQLLGRPMDIFATPYCAWNQNVAAAAKRYYTSMRNCDADVNRRGSFDPWNIRSVIVTNTTTPAQIQQWLDRARADRAWLVLVYHEVRPVADNTFSITPEALRSHMQLVRDSGLAVVTTRTALAEIRSQG